MRRLSRIWKVYIFSTVMVVLVMVVVGSVLGAHLKRRLEGQMKEDVLTLARVIGKALPDSEAPSVLNPFCRNYEETAGVRITVVRSDGRVVGESGGTPPQPGPHLDRPEIRDAMKNGIGTSIRYSDTLRMEMLYVALFAKEKGKVVRLAKPMTKVKEAQNEVMVFLVIALFLAPIVTIVVAFFIARYVRLEAAGTL